MRTIDVKNINIAKKYGALWSVHSFNKYSLLNVKEINSRTCECKKVKNLYFVGEVLDIDALTGGFNLQIAWSTGYVAGNSIIK